MSDDLVKRAERELEAGVLPPDPMALIRAQTVRDLIDRIEELETALSEQIEWVKRLADDLIAAEAKLAKAVELANLVVEFSDRALWKVAKNTVLEIKGEK